MILCHNKIKLLFFTYFGWITFFFCFKSLDGIRTPHLGITNPYPLLLFELKKEDAWIYFNITKKLT